MCKSLCLHTITHHEYLSNVLALFLDLSLHKDASETLSPLPTTLLDQGCVGCIQSNQVPTFSVLPHPTDQAAKDVSIDPNHL